MSSRTLIFSLSCTAGILVALYVVVVAMTMYFASVRTELSAASRELESEIAVLETKYYDAISRISSTDTLSEGYVTPIAVEYVAKGKEPTLTRADQ